MSNLKCQRCGTDMSLEEDHIIPRSKGGSDEPSNKRWLCQGCHDYRHARDAIITEINKQLRVAKYSSQLFNSAKFGMWIFRLGILEAFNTPEMIRERSSYLPYFEINATHYSVWYPQIKANSLNKGKILPLKQVIQMPLLEENQE